MKAQAATGEMAPSISRSRAMLARLREEADRLVAFSESKLVLREAAFTIERLERDNALLQAELGRVKGELAHERNRRPQ